MLDFEECEQSGHLRASGNHGEYWIIQGPRVYLERVNPGPHGVITEELGNYDDVEEAEHFADLAEDC